MTNLVVEDTESTWANRAHLHPSIAEPGSELLISTGLQGAALQQLKAMGVDELRRRAVVAWEPPDGDSSLFGLGVALRLRGAPGSGPHEAFPRIRSLARAALLLRVDPSARPRFFGGWRFSPARTSEADPAWDAFGGWQFIVPTLTVAVCDGRWSASLTGLRDGGTSLPEDELLRGALAATPQRPGPEPGDTAVGPRAALDADGWKLAVADAIDEIGRGYYEKIVLARQVSLNLDSRTDSATLRERLRARYPNCWVFGFGAGTSTWLGASPELMVSVHAGRVKAASLAGSRKRGATPAEDASLANELRSSAKERHEHALVARAIRGGLAPFCTTIEAPTEPELLRMHNIQHLYTPIQGRLQDRFDVLDLAAALHPTPAVGGWPRASALCAIERIERMDRGWYAAPFGWVDFDGDGIFAVGLRAGLLKGSELTLYAGNGIVAGSTPEAELAETELKLSSVRAAALES